MSFAVAIVLWLCAQPAPATELSARQRAQILGEAEAAYLRGSQLSQSDVAEAKQAFTIAAQKYRLLLDSGIRNARLSLNLGHAYLQSGAIGKAIAQYEQAAALAPGDAQIAASLNRARAMLPAKNSASGSVDQAEWISSLSAWSAAVPARARLWAGLLGWNVLWLCLAGWWISGRGPFRRVAIASAIFVLLAAGSLGLDRLLLPQGERAVIVVPEAVVRAGNDAAFEVVAGATAVEGEILPVVERRPGWVRIRLQDGSTGWIEESASEIVHPGVWF